MAKNRGRAATNELAEPSGSDSIVKEEDIEDAGEYERRVNEAMALLSAKSSQLRKAPPNDVGLAELKSVKAALDSGLVSQSDYDDMKRKFLLAKEETMKSEVRRMGEADQVVQSYAAYAYGLRTALQHFQTTEAERATLGRECLERARLMVADGAQKPKKRRKSADALGPASSPSIVSDAPSTGEIEEFETEAEALASRSGKVTDVDGSARAPEISAMSMGIGQRLEVLLDKPPKYLPGTITGWKDGLYVITYDDGSREKGKFDFDKNLKSKAYQAPPFRLLDRPPSVSHGRSSIDVDAQGCRVCEHCQKFKVHWDGLDKAVRQRMSIALSQHRPICSWKRRASQPSEKELYLERKKQIESRVSELMADWVKANPPPYTEERNSKGDLVWSLYTLGMFDRIVERMGVDKARSRGVYRWLQNILGADQLLKELKEKASEKVPNISFAHVKRLLEWYKAALKEKEERKAAQSAEGSSDTSAAQEPSTAPATQRPTEAAILFRMCEDSLPSGDPRSFLGLSPNHGRMVMCRPATGRFYHRTKYSTESTGAKVSSRGGQKKTPVKAKPKSSVPRQRAEKFIAQVKDRFKDKPSVFSDFLRLMKLYRGKKKSEMETVETVAMMFRNHKDLLQGFGWFCSKKISVMVEGKNDTVLVAGRPLESVK